MQENSFRAVVREELLNWTEKNRQRFDLLILRIAEQLTPILAAELEHGILVRIGRVEADEREQAKMLLEQARLFVTRYGLKDVKGVDQYDVLLKDLDAGIARLSTGRPMPEPIA